jgi:hypothetical protein
MQISLLFFFFWVCVRIAQRDKDALAELAAIAERVRIDEVPVCDWMCIIIIFKNIFVIFDVRIVRCVIAAILL